MTLATKSLGLFELICDYPYILLRLQRDNYRHELQNLDIHFLHIKQYTLLIYFPCKSFTRQQ